MGFMRRIGRQFSIPLNPKGDFNEKETNLIEIIAGRIAVELEREVLIRDHANRRQDHGSSEGPGLENDLLLEKGIGLAKGLEWDAAVAWQKQTTCDAVWRCRRPSWPSHPRSKDHRRFCAARHQGETGRE